VLCVESQSALSLREDWATEANALGLRRTRERSRLICGQAEGQSRASPFGAGRIRGELARQTSRQSR
jgi:hypothetical protein